MKPVTQAQQKKAFHYLKGAVMHTQNCCKGNKDEAFLNAQTLTVEHKTRSELIYKEAELACLHL